MSSKKFNVQSESVKVLQFIIAVACWAIVCEREQSNEKGLHSLLEKYYRGDASYEDIIPMLISLYEGENRFSCLYEDSKFEKFAPCFGPLIGGFQKKYFKDFLEAKTVKNKTAKLVGRDIKSKIDKVTKWMEQLILSH